MADRRRSLLRGLGLSLAAALVALALAELLARVLTDPPPLVRVVQAGSSEARRAAESGELRMALGPQGDLVVRTATGWRLRANTTAVISGHHLGGREIEVRTNSLGYRNRELGEKRGTRVLFLGDSITLGDYLHEEETYVRRVEQLFRAEGRAVETINSAVGGVGLENELAILYETGLALEPDAVVLGFYLNDVSDSAGVSVVRVPGLLRWSQLARMAAHALARPSAGAGAGSRDARRQRWQPELAERYPAAPGDPLRQQAAFNGLVVEAAHDWGSAWSEGAWELLELQLEELQRLSAVHGFQLLVVGFPVRAQVEAEFVPDFPQRRLAAVAARLDVPLLDLLPPLRAAWRDSGAELFYDHCHHTPHGNELIAGRVHAFLGEALSDP